MATLNIMVGIPGCGKTTYVKKYLINSRTKYLSSDEIRCELFGFEDQNHNGQVFEEMNKRALKYLYDEWDVVYDAANLNAKRRIELIQKVKPFHHVNAYMACAPINVLLERNMTRTERHLPWDKLELLIKSIEPPMYYEGFDNIFLIDGGMYDDIYDYNELLKKCFNYEQENPYHKETLDVHITSVVNNASKYNDLVLKQAARYHDFGKLYTKMFNEKKGYYVYYGHEKVSTYLFLCHARKQNMIDDLERVRLNNDTYKIAALILNHMEWCCRDDMTPIKERLGNELFEKLKLLHQADDEGRVGINAQ